MAQIVEGSSVGGATMAGPRAWLIVVMACALGACDTLDIFRSTDASFVPETAAEAGAVYVSVQHLRPWADVADSLRPNFANTTADDLLDDVLPVTVSDTFGLKSGTSFGVAANLAATSVTKTNTTNQSTNLVSGDITEATQEFERTRTVEPGQRPEVQRSAPAITTPAAGQFSPDIDPFFQRRVATALFQEIQLLNSYVSGQVAGSDEVPFLMRTQITLIPYARKEAIDVHTRLWVTLEEEENSGGSRFSDKDVRIVPLLIIDNMERSSAKRTAQSILQLDAQISALAGGTGLGAGVGSMRERLRELAGNDYNSLVSVAQSGRSELLIRLGASQGVTAEYELRPRTYDVTFLVLIKQGKAVAGNMLSVGETSVYRDTRSGRVLPITSVKYVSELRREIASRLDAKYADGDASKKALEASDAISCLTLRDLGTPECGQVLKANSDIHDLIWSYLETSNASFADTPIPDWKPLLPPPQYATLIDQPNAGGVVELSGARSLNGDGSVRAFLIVGPKTALQPLAPKVTGMANSSTGNGAPTGDSIWSFSLKRALLAIQENNAPVVQFASKSTTVSPDGNLRFTFPSPGAHVPAIMPKDAGPLEYWLVVLRSSQTRPTRNSESLELRSPQSILASRLDEAEDGSLYPVLLNSELSKLAKLQAEFEATGITKTLRADANGQASFRLALSRGTAAGNIVSGYNLVVVNADLAGALRVDVAAARSSVGVTVSAAKNAVKLTDDGTYEIALKNLPAEKSVAIRIAPIDSQGREQPSGAVTVEAGVAKQ